MNSDEVVETEEKLRRQVEIAQEERDACKERFRNAETAMWEAAVKYARVKYGVSVGCIVRSTRVPSVLMQVEAVDPLMFDLLGKPRLRVRKQNKDGSWSRAVQTAWADWVLDEAQ